MAMKRTGKDVWDEGTEGWQLKNIMKEKVLEGCLKREPKGTCRGKAEAQVIELCAWTSRIDLAEQFLGVSLAIRKDIPVITKT